MFCLGVFFLLQMRPFTPKTEQNEALFGICCFKLLLSNCVLKFNILQLFNLILGTLSIKVM